MNTLWKKILSEKKHLEKIQKCIGKTRGFCNISFEKAISTFYNLWFYNWDLITKFWQKSSKLNIPFLVWILSPLLVLSITCFDYKELCPGDYKSIIALRSDDYDFSVFEDKGILCNLSLLLAIYYVNQLIFRIMEFLVKTFNRHFH